MKNFLLFFFILLTPIIGYAGPLSLLECEFPGAPIQKSVVYAYLGKLVLLTFPAEGAWNSRDLSEQELEKRVILFVNQPDLKGVVYLEDEQWFYTLKGPNNWRMHGNAHCFGPYS